MTGIGVRREKAALSSGCKSHPATAPAGSNRSSYGGDAALFLAARSKRQQRSKPLAMTPFERISGGICAAGRHFISQSGS
jgi:hypothetical protein